MKISIKEKPNNYVYMNWCTKLCQTHFSWIYHPYDGIIYISFI